MAKAFAEQEADILFQHLPDGIPLFMGVWENMISGRCIRWKPVNVYCLRIDRDRSRERFLFQRMLGASNL